MKRIFIILFLFIILSSGVFSLGRKDEQKPDEIDWTNKEESTLFGLVEITKDKNVVMIVDTDETGQTVYTLTGDLEKDVRKMAGNYLYILGRISGAEEKIVLITEVRVVQESPDPDWNNARQIEIEGKIELGMNNMVCIVTNWESKSRVSHYVYGPKTDEIKKSTGRIIKVIGIEDTSPTDKTPFIKAIFVVTIISLIED